jgi:hypothetical protein
MVKFIQERLHLGGKNMKRYEQCSRSNNPKDLDTYIINKKTGLDVLVKCVTADREKKAKQEKVRY